MPQEMQNLIDKYIIELKRIYGTHLKQIILYDSYARGDFNEDSDVDIMVLVDLTDEKINDYLDDLSEVEFNYNVDYDVWMMSVVKNIDHFRHWSQAHPFYADVVKDGILLYEAA